mmetsp:Transcript_1596/g.1539  ORF Transcript_1596/g.1539 Transcript_1596/m.1539 type:complete len:87 (-) Transcript_1596:23-283(-)
MAASPQVKAFVLAEDVLTHNEFMLSDQGVYMEGALDVPIFLTELRERLFFLLRTNFMEVHILVQVSCAILRLRLLQVLLLFSLFTE